MATFELIVVVLCLVAAPLVALTDLMRASPVLRRGVGGYFQHGDRRDRR